MQHTYSILDYGALPNGEIMTERIQAAIDACFLAGGGRVVIPAGDFLTGGIRLRSHVHLHMEEGAHLIGSRDPEDYMSILKDTVEPLAEKDRTDAVWAPAHKRTNHDFINIPGSRWNNALIRAIDAEDIKITGSKDSYIDGQDCYDALGESRFRGPHAINFHRCRNITLQSYTVKNSANWAHMILDCQNILAEHLTVEGGHDGFHIRSCDNVSIFNGYFATGDDCIAGFDNQNVTVRRCYINTACNGMRFGGTNILIDHCVFEGPAKFVFRHSLSKEEQASGRMEKNDNHRYNMLSAFTYFSDFTRTVREEPGNILLKNCTVKNVDRLFHYNFSGNELWQKNRPLRSIVFDGLQAEGVKHPLNAYGDTECPLLLTVRNASIAFAEEREYSAMMHAYGFERILLENVRVENAVGHPLIRLWSKEGDLTVRNLTCDRDTGEISALSDEPFFAQPI